MALALGYPRLNQSHIARFMGKTRAIDRRERAREANKQAFISATEVSASAFAFGLASGYAGGMAFFGMPIEALGGVAMHLAAFTSRGKKYAPHLQALGNGALATFFAGLGTQVGRQLPAVPGIPGLSGDDVMGQATAADAELARMVAAGR